VTFLAAIVKKSLVFCLNHRWRLLLHLLKINLPEVMFGSTDLSPMENITLAVISVASCGYKQNISIPWQTTVGQSSVKSRNALIDYSFAVILCTAILSYIDSIWVSTRSPVTHEL